MNYYEIISILVAIIALAISGYSIFVSKKIGKKQIQANTVNGYTKQYMEITMKILTDSKCDKISCQRLFIKLYSIEFHSQKNGDLSDEVWSLWLDGMRKAVREESLQIAWKQDCNIYDSEFAQFFGDLIKENENHCSA